MKLDRLSLSFTSAEISTAIKTAVTRASAAQAQLPPELADLAVEMKKGELIVSTKKKLGFMPATLSATITLKPTDDEEGIVVTLSKLSAGFVGSQAIAAQVLSEVGRALTGVPGCRVSGNDIILTKEALAAKVPWLSVPGKISRCGITDDTLEIAIG